MEKKNKKDIVYSVAVGIVFFGLSIFCWLKPSDEFSAPERRKLNKFPELTPETLTNGKFMSEFEEYTLDQFPLRDEFRGIKAIIHKYVLGQSDNNNVYIEDGYISKLDYLLSEKAMESAVNKFGSIYEKYIAGTEAKLYYSLIPDKNYFLAEENGYLSYDYNNMFDYMKEHLDYMKNIDITHLLTIDDYYHTDTHWKQENIQDVAQHIAGEMGVTLNETYQQVTLDTPFYGVYYGQLALPVKPDSITYMESEIFSDCVIINHEKNQEIPMYDLTLAQGRDPYEMFLSGSLSVITIENPNASSDKELVIFRDSFGSSIAPYFVEGYKKITMFDVRYLNEKLIGNFVEFSNQDVLFLFSTGVINNETAFK